MAEADERDQSVFGCDFYNCIKQYCYDWSLHRYSMISHFPKALIGPQLVVGLFEDNELKIQLTGNEDKLKIEISLQKIEACRKYAPYNKTVVNLEFLDNSNNVMCSFTELPVKPKYTNEIISYIWKQEVNCERFLTDDSLKLRVSLCLFYTAFEKDEVGCTKSIRILADNMRHLARGSLIPDLSIKVGGKCISAHKCIVLPQCSYFAHLNSEIEAEQSELFSEDTTSINLDSLNDVHESNDISNTSAEILHSIMNFLYCGILPTSVSINNFQWKEVARKYELLNLFRVLVADRVDVCSTTMAVNAFFPWNIDNITVKTSEAFYSERSPAFRFRVGNYDVAWIVGIIFITYNDISLFLKKIDGFEKNTRCEFKLKIYDRNGDAYEERKFLHTFIEQSQSPYPALLSSDSCFSIPGSIIFRDRLTIGCEITVSEDEIATRAAEIFCHRPFQQDWIKNLEYILVTGIHSDLLIFVEDIAFKAHKVILSARSRVFKAMLENSTSRIRIEDMSKTVMKCVLTYMYCAKLGDLTMDDAFEVYSAAFKYEIAGLKDKCSQFIIINMDLDWANKAIVLSNVYRDVKMFEAANSVIRMNVR